MLNIKRLQRVDWIGFMDFLEAFVLGIRDSPDRSHLLEEHAPGLVALDKEASQIGGPCHIWCDV